MAATTPTTVAQTVSTVFTVTCERGTGTGSRSLTGSMGGRTGLSDSTHKPPGRLGPPGKLGLPRPERQCSPPRRRLPGRPAAGMALRRPNVLREPGHVEGRSGEASVRHGWHGVHRREV